MDDEPQRTRPASRWAIAEILVWTLCVVIALGSIPRAGALGVLFALFCVHRLAGSLALLSVGSEISFGDLRGVQTIAGWLYFTRTLVFGSLLMLGGIAVIVAQPNRAGIVLGVLAVWIGAPFLILGIQVTHRFRAARARSAATDTPSLPS